MDTRFHSEEKSIIKPTPLAFLKKTSLNPQEQILKADLLLQAIKDKDKDFVNEIISSQGNQDYINFRFYKTFIYDLKTKTRVAINYYYDFPDNLPRTALTLAVYYGMKDIVVLLIKNGADVNFSSGVLFDEPSYSKYNYSPLEYAIHHRKSLGEKAATHDDYQQIALLLKEKGATVTEYLLKLDTDGLISPKKIERPSSPELNESLFFTKTWRGKVLPSPNLDEKKTHLHL